MSSGLQISEEMRRLLAREDRFLSSTNGGQRLAHLYHLGSVNFTPMELSPFGLACYWGRLDDVTSMVENGHAPDICGTETAYKHSYASIVVLGAQRVLTAPPGSKGWTNVLKYLLARGLPPDVEDILGYTALEHATMNQLCQLDLARILLTSSHSGGPANPNHRNRRGMTPIWGPMINDITDSVDLLMEFGADLEIPDADNSLPSTFYIKCGPKVAAIVSKWLRKRRGEDDLLDLNRCGNSQCPASNSNVELKACSRCKTVRYCSPACQRAHWSSHKVTCVAFSGPAVVTLKPHYNTGPSELHSTSTFMRHLMGIPTEPTPARHHRSAHVPKSVSGPSAKPKALVIKVQVPEGFGPLLVYTKKRDFVCMIWKSENSPEQYDKIVAVVETKGIGGLKAYFAAELKTKDELVVKIDSVLAEQPF